VCSRAFAASTQAVAADTRATDAGSQAISARTPAAIARSPAVAARTPAVITRTPAAATRTPATDARGQAVSARTPAAAMSTRAGAADTPSVIRSTRAISACGPTADSRIDSLDACAPSPGACVSAFPGGAEGRDAPVHTRNSRPKPFFPFCGGSVKRTHVKTQTVGYRVQGFMDAHADVVAGIVRPEVRAELDRLVQQLDGYAVEQKTTTSGALTATATKSELRKDFYEGFIKPIARITKRVIGRVPDFDAMVLKAEVSDEPSFLATANALADAVQKYEAVFVTNGMASDFVAQIRASIGQMTTTTATRDRQVGRRVGSTAGLVAADKAFRELLAQLDALLVPALKRNPAVLADWKAVSRIPQLPVNPVPTGGVVLPTTSTADSALPAALPAVTEVKPA
jgi:hypothetical protein